ncbi:MAG: DUF2155 domain-containing protein [Hyphomicrobiales bacterium]
MNHRSLLRAVAAAVAAGMVVLALGAPAGAEKIENQIAVFSGLDKITAKITSFEVPLNAKKIFGVLEVTARVCYSRPPTEPPKTTAFVEVHELRSDAAPRRIFSGWMFADSPGLNAVEHPVYDIWLTSCKTASGSPSPSNE